VDERFQGLKMQPISAYRECVLFIFLHMGDRTKDQHPQGGCLWFVESGRQLRTNFGSNGIYGADINTTPIYSVFMSRRGDFETMAVHSNRRLSTGL